MNARPALSEPQSAGFPGERKEHPTASSPARQAPLIVHVVYRLDVGGLENGLVNLINHMPADEFGHAIVCLTDYSPVFCRRLRRDDVKVFALQKRQGKDVSAYWRFWKLMRWLSPDIVHTRNLGTTDLLPVAALAGVPVRIHGEHGWDVHDMEGRRLKYRWLRRGVSPFATRFIALSSHLQDWLVETVGLPRRKVVQIYNGVDTAHFRPAPRDLRDGAPVLVGTVGRMEFVKDPVNLANAFQILLADRSELRRRLRLVMVGGGALLPEVRSRLQAVGLADSVELTGPVADVREQLHRLDLFVLPSRNEGISNTILEAMACGLPVVATRVGGNPELVVENGTGLLVPPGDAAALARAIGQYIDSPALRSEHGVAGRRRAEREFGLDAMVSAYRDLYRKLLGMSEMKEV